MIAENGSILAYAYNQKPEPAIRAIRTEAITYAAAYKASTKKNASGTGSTSSKPPESDLSIMYESPSANTSTIVTSVGDNILLAVTGSTPQAPEPENDDTEEERSSPAHSQSDKSTSTSPWQHVTKIEVVEKASEELSALVREQLIGLRWPDDL